MLATSNTSRFINDQAPTAMTSSEEMDNNAAVESLAPEPVHETQDTVVREDVKASWVHKPPLDPRVLRNVVDSYEGETLQVPQCDLPVYHGHGTAVFRTGFTYTGSFCRGRMHGHGRIEWTSGVAFEGTFVDNEMQGQGTYTWPNGSTYTGDIVRGRRHGKGVFMAGTMGSVELNEHSDLRGDQGSPSHAMAPIRFTYEDDSRSETIIDASSSARYEGEWVDGLPHGRGVLVFDDDQHVRYEGEFVAGKRHGHGEMRYASGNVYVGQWQHDVKCGHGTMLWMADSRMTAVEKYDGQWRDDRPHGHGRHVWLGTSTKRREKNWYEGRFEHGVRQGLGVFFYANGARYEGEWVDNVKHDRGVFYYEDGRVFVGDFRDDRAVEPSTNGGNGESTTTPAKILLYVDDLLPVDARDRAKKLIEHAVLRFNTELRALYRQYIAQPSPPSPTRQSIASTSPAKTSSDSGDSTALLMEYYECRRLLADCGVKLSGGHLEHVLQTIREAQRTLTGVADASDLPVIPTTDPVTLGISLPEVVPPERLLLYREFVELVVRLAHENHTLQDDGTYPPLPLADAFTAFVEQLSSERQKRQIALRSNESVAPSQWTLLQQLHAKELHLVYQKHHTRLGQLFTLCQSRPSQSDTDDGEIAIAPTSVTVRAMMSVLQQLHVVFSPTFRVRHALAVVQQAFMAEDSDASANDSVDVEIDPFFVSSPLVFTDFVDALAVVVLEKHRREASAEITDLDADALSPSHRPLPPLFALLDAFLQTLPSQ